jgi:hypothetical protein
VDLSVELGVAGPGPACSQVSNRSGLVLRGLVLAPGKVRQGGGERVETSSQAGTVSGRDVVSARHRKPGTTSSAWSANASSVLAR